MCLIVIFVIFTAHRTAYNGGFQLLSLVCRSTYRADDDACARLSSRRLHFTWSQLHRLRVHYGWYVFDIIGEFFFLFPTLHGRVENKLSRLSVLFWWQKKNCFIVARSLVGHQHNIYLNDSDDVRRNAIQIQSTRNITDTTTLLKNTMFFVIFQTRIIEIRIIIITKTTINC